MKQAITELRADYRVACVRDALTLALLDGIDALATVSIGRPEPMRAALDQIRLFSRERDAHVRTIAAALVARGGFGRIEPELRKLAAGAAPSKAPEMIGWQLILGYAADQLSQIDVI